jgi:4-carboxymuconolactone decarboxylase
VARLTAIWPEDMDATQRRVVDAALAGRRQYLPAPLTAWLRSPDMAMLAQSLGEAIRFDLHLPAAVTAVAAFTAAVHWQAGYVKNVQEAKLRTEGVADDAIVAIQTGTTPTFADAGQAMAHDVTRRLLTGQGVDDSAYAGAVAILGERGMVELVAAIGYYTMVALTVISFQITSAEPAP